jgi:hypothetical protein
MVPTKDVESRVEGSNHAKVTREPNAEAESSALVPRDSPAIEHHGIVTSVSKGPLATEVPYSAPRAPLAQRIHGSSSPMVDLI